MKTFTVFVVCGLFAAFLGGDLVTAASRAKGQYVVPAEPSIRVIGLPATATAPASVRFEVRGKCGESFTLVGMLRTPEGELMLDPTTGQPISTIIPGLVLPPSGVWSETHALTSLAAGMPDYVIEVAAIPTVFTPGAHVLSWTCSISSESSGGVAPPSFESQWVEVPGVAGVFLSTFVSTSVVGGGTEALLYLMAENGPGGVYPIG